MNVSFKARVKSITNKCVCQVYVLLPLNQPRYFKSAGHSCRKLSRLFQKYANILIYLFTLFLN